MELAVDNFKIKNELAGHHQLVIVLKGRVLD